MPKVSFLTTGLAIGGAENQVVSLAESLKHRGWQVEVISMLPPEHFVSRLRDLKIPVSDLGMRRGVPDPRGLVRLVARLRRSRPQVLHCHMVHANILGRLSRIFHRVPVVISTAHSVMEGSKWRDLAYRITDPLVDVLTQVSQAGAQRYVADRISDKSKTIWVPNGVDVTKFRCDAQRRAGLRARLGWDDRFVWLAVGNLREPKDYPNMLSAFREVAIEFPKGLLAIAGTGSLEAELRSLSESQATDRRVEFLGSRSDVADLLNAADAYVLSSAWEGTPIALLEAAAAFRPIVATAVGGNADVINSPDIGILVPPRDSAALATAMKKVMALPEQRRHELGRAARTRVEKHYSLDAVSAKWDNIYRQLLSVRAIESRSSSGFLFSKLHH